jgi:serine/threonine-protein kinase
VGAELPPVGTEVDGLLLERRLGAGSFGTVYRARRGEQRYAVKFISLAQAGAWALRELEVLLRVKRVGGVALEGHGSWPARRSRFLYLMMEYVEGRPLPQWAEERNPTARQTASLVLELVRQLWAVHRVGVVHRDVKAANVLVREGDGKPVLVDFGVGTFPGALEATRLVLPGTRLYHCPELVRAWRGRKPGERLLASHRVDLWALGVLLYWLLTGRYPFEGEDELALEEAITHQEPVPPHVRNPRVPRALSELCLRMLEKSPEARYADAGVVGAELKALLKEAEGDVAWDVPLCEAWSPEQASPPLEGTLSLEELRAWLRQKEEEARRSPRRGRPRPVEEPSTLLPPTAVEPPSAGELEEEGADAPASSAAGELAVPAPLAVKGAAAPMPSSEEGLGAPVPPVAEGIAVLAPLVVEAAAVPMPSSGEGAVAPVSPAAEAIAVFVPPAVEAASASVPAEQPPSAGPAREAAGRAVSVSALAPLVASQQWEVWRRPRLWAGVGALLVVGGLALLSASDPPRAEGERAAQAAPEGVWPPPGWEGFSRLEVAPRCEPLEGGDGAVPPWGATPAPVASATLAEEGIRVMTPIQSPMASLPLDNCPAWLKACVTTAAICQVACAGAQVRPLPPPQDCPPDWERTMLEEFDLPYGATHTAILPHEGSAHVITVREGPIEIEVLGEWEKMPDGTFLTGQLYFGEERVYARLDKARLPGDRILPVCFEINDQEDRKRGVRKEPGSGRNEARVFSTVEVVTVPRFQ